jgi:hypothetical protein
MKAIYLIKIIRRSLTDSFLFCYLKIKWYLFNLSITTLHRKPQHYRQSTTFMLYLVL